MFRLSFHFTTFCHHLNHNLPLILIPVVSLVQFHHKNQSLVSSGSLETLLYKLGKWTSVRWCHIPNFKKKVLVFGPLWSLLPTVLLCSSGLSLSEFFTVNVLRFLLSQVAIPSLLSIFHIFSSADDAFFICLCFLSLRWVHRKDWIGLTQRCYI